MKAASARHGSAGLAFIVAAFYFLSPIVYTYFAWGKAVQFWVPVAFFDTPAGRATAAFVNWYNEELDFSATARTILWNGRFRTPRAIAIAQS